MLKDPIPLAALHRALVIKLRHHGDVLLTTPVFSALKAIVPQIEIDALVYAETAEMLSLHPAISELHKIERHTKHKGFMAQCSAELALLRRLRERRYDLVLHLCEHPRGAWMTRLTGARWAVAPQVPGRSFFWRESFTHLYAEPRGRPRHTVERNLDALRRVGIVTAWEERENKLFRPPPLALVPGAEAQERVDTLLAGRGLEAKRFILMHPASRWTFKCWTSAGWVDLIQRCVDAGWQVVLVSGPAVEETAMVAAITTLSALTPLSVPGADSGPVHNLAGQLSLKELAALTARARLLVGVDSAPMHIAAAVGTPVVALFGPSSEREWGPWQVPHRIVSNEAFPCRPCGIDGCGGGKNAECVSSIEAGKVFAAAQDLLAE
ncbi:MAG: putative lipopolysaccharide heptosyltransferase III [Betaproteobacteria bacterium]|nr:putative lipopolysaccharide heptosyltransferase III [Betaproteobacteria bacterium]